VIRDGRALLIRRGASRSKGNGSIPGGLLELGETIHPGGWSENCLRKTGLKVQVIEFDRGFRALSFPRLRRKARPRWACRRCGGPAPLYHL